MEKETVFSLQLPALQNRITDPIRDKFSIKNYVIMATRPAAFAHSAQMLAFRDVGVLNYCHLILFFAYSKTQVRSQPQGCSRHSYIQQAAEAASGPRLELDDH